MPTTFRDWVEFHFLLWASVTRVASELWSWPTHIDSETARRHEEDK